MNESGKKILAMKSILEVLLVEPWRVASRCRSRRYSYKSILQINFGGNRQRFQTVFHLVRQQAEG